MKILVMALFPLVLLGMAVGFVLALEWAEPRYGYRRSAYVLCAVAVVCGGSIGLLAGWLT